MYLRERGVADVLTGLTQSLGMRSHTRTPRVHKRYAYTERIKALAVVIVVLVGELV